MSQHRTKQYTRDESRYRGFACDALERFLSARGTPVDRRNPSRAVALVTAWHHHSGIRLVGYNSADRVVALYQTMLKRGMDVPSYPGAAPKRYHTMPEVPMTGTGIVNLKRLDH